jgi:dihydrodipicolinate synthase/N-acetylneuraminate lyase
MEILQSHGNLETTQTIAKIIGCPPQTECRAPLVKATPTQLTEHAKVEVVPT